MPELERDRAESRVDDVANFSLSKIQLFSLSFLQNHKNTSEMNTNTTTTHHGGLDGTIAGGGEFLVIAVFSAGSTLIVATVLGHEGAHGHTGRDAVLGGIAGSFTRSLSSFVFPGVPHCRR